MEPNEQADIVSAAANNGAGLTIQRPTCNAPAPLVVNGGAYVGCVQPPDHEGDHSTSISWAR